MLKFLTLKEPLLLSKCTWLIKLEEIKSDLIFGDLCILIGWQRYGEREKSWIGWFSPPMAIMVRAGMFRSRQLCGSAVWEQQTRTWTIFWCLCRPLAGSCVASEVTGAQQWYCWRDAYLAKPCAALQVLSYIQRQVLLIS